MKKDRDFFSQYSMSGYNTQPNFEPYMMPNTYMNNEIDSRIKAIEEHLNNINQRLTKLESTLSNQAINDYNFANSMYMV